MTTDISTRRMGNGCMSKMTGEANKEVEIRKENDRRAKLMKTEDGRKILATENHRVLVRNMLANPPHVRSEFKIDHRVCGEMQVFVQDNDTNHNKMIFMVMKLDSDCIDTAPVWRFVDTNDKDHRGMKMFLSSRSDGHMRAYYGDEIDQNLGTTVRHVVITGYSQTGKSGFVDVLVW